MSSRRTRGTSVFGAALALSATMTGCSLLSGGTPAGVPTDPATGISSTVSTPTASTGPTAATTRTAQPTAVATLPPISIPSFPTPDVPTVKATEPGPSGLRVRTVKVRGRAGSASWGIAIPHFSGQGASEVNRRVRAAVDDLVGQVKRETTTDGGDRRTLSGTGTVSTNDGRTVQVVILFTDYLAGTAHPALYVTTTVVDLRKSRPVLLGQVVQNPPEGLRFLRAEVIKAARRKGEPVDKAGLTPTARHYANWQTTGKGITFSFDDYQLGGHGIRSYTVPWNRARLVLSAYGEKLLLP